LRKLIVLYFCFLTSAFNAQEASQNEIVLKGIEASNYLTGSEVVRLYPYTKIPAFIKFRGNSGISEEQGEFWLSRFAKLDHDGGLKQMQKGNR
jgi:hypothetical protein